MGDGVGEEGGVLALSFAPDVGHPDPVPAIKRAGHGTPSVRRDEGTVLAGWGRFAGTTESTVVVAGPVRSVAGHVVNADLALDPASDGSSALHRMTPPYAAIRVANGQVDAATDSIGYAQLFLRAGRGWSAVSTSPRALAELGEVRIDRQALAVQATLGWQLADRTVYEAVRKLAPGERLVATGGEVLITGAEPARPASFRTTAALAARQAAEFLRDYLTRYLDDHPEAVLQLSGGIDTRVLLAAIPPGRRTGLRAMTLATAPASGDVTVARVLADRTGLRHLVADFAPLDALTPEEANDAVCRAARELFGMADPVAHGALRVVEQQFPQGDRIAGTGGEVARGFYYAGVTAPVPVTRPLSALVASLRMFANGSADPAALDPGFRVWARPFATAEVHRLLLETGLPWAQATDHFYLLQRMQRWSGIIDTAVRPGRRTLNPMLDPGFLDIVDGLRPRDRSGPQFLSRVVCALDPDLARIPLDGRREPAAYVDRSVSDRLSGPASSAKKVVRKVRQRAERRTIPPAGGSVLAAKVLQHWRANPDVLDTARATGLLDAGWLEMVLAGEPASPATVGYLAILATLE